MKDSPHTVRKPSPPVAKKELPRHAKEYLDVPPMEVEEGSPPVDGAEALPPLDTSAGPPSKSEHHLKKQHPGRKPDKDVSD